MSNYRRGADFERRIARYYLKMGYFVIRSAGSHSPIDLVALKAGEVELVQCKIDGVLSVAGRQQLQELTRDTGCQVLLISRKDRKLYAERIREE